MTAPITRICPVDGQIMPARAGKLFCSKRCRDAAKASERPASVNAGATIWVAAEKSGRSKFERLANGVILAIEALEHERDAIASALAAGRFDGPDFHPLSRDAVAEGIAAVDDAKLDEVITAILPFACRPEMPDLPIAQDARFIRERDLLEAAGLRWKDVRRELLRRGWVLL